MKRFLIKIFIGILPVLLFLFILECIIRIIPNEYSYKYNYLKNHKEIRTLIVGASDGRTGINPKYLGKNAFNSAMVSQDMLENCEIINRYIKSADSLKNVIVTLTPTSYHYFMRDGLEPWRLRRYRIFMDLNLEEKEKFIYSFEISNLGGVKSQIVKYLNDANYIDCYSDGFGMDSVIYNERRKMEQALDISSKHNLAKTNECKRNPEILEKMIRMCKEKNIKVFLVYTPTYHYYYENIDKELDYKCDSISQSIAAKNSNVVYLNLFRDNRFLTEDFRNSNHLGPKGAKKLALILNEIINADNER